MEVERSTGGPVRKKYPWEYDSCWVADIAIVYFREAVRIRRARKQFLKVAVSVRKSGVYSTICFLDRILLYFEVFNLHTA